MTTGFRDTAFADIGRVYVRETTMGSPAEIAIIRVRTDTGLETVWSKPSALSAVCDEEAYGGVASGSARSVLTSAVAVTVTGGFPPYSFNWVRTDSDPADWSATSPTAGSTRFSAASVDPNDIQNSIWQCEVEDDRGNIATSNPVSATAENFGGAPL